MELEKLQGVIESILFVSGEPIKRAKLMKIVGLRAEEVDAALA
ncbi:MAG: hypothetical protein US09_C0010G0001, partial [Candidatus Moranbacteria bacterium GW2011_GWD1_36_198]